MRGLRWIDVWPVRSEAALGAGRRGRAAAALQLVPGLVYRSARLVERRNVLQPNEQRKGHRNNRQPYPRVPARVPHVRRLRQDPPVRCVLPRRRATAVAIADAGAAAAHGRRRCYTGGAAATPHAGRCLLALSGRRARLALAGQHAADHRARLQSGQQAGPVPARARALVRLVRAALPLAGPLWVRQLHGAPRRLRRALPAGGRAREELLLLRAALQPDGRAAPAALAAQAAALALRAALHPARAKPGAPAALAALPPLPRRRHVHPARGLRPAAHEPRAAALAARAALAPLSALAPPLPPSAPPLPPAPRRPLRRRCARRRHPSRRPRPRRRRRRPRRPTRRRRPTGRRPCRARRRSARTRSRA